jgi:hypothetical protein
MLRLGDDMTVRPLPDPDDETTGTKDRNADSGNVIQIICPGCRRAILLDPRRVKRLRGKAVLRCSRCDEVVAVRKNDKTRPVPDDIAELYIAEPTDSRPSGWKRFLGSRH